MNRTDWRERYPERVSSYGPAIAAIARGRRILVGSGAAEPEGLVNALITHGEHLADNEIVHLLTLGSAPYVEPGYDHRFRHLAFFIGPNVREAVHAGRADFMPVFLSEIPELIRRRRVRIDVALIQVSPPDEHGYASLGVSVDIVRAAVDTADLVIAEVNDRMPRTLGDSFVHVSRIAHLIPVSRPLPNLEVKPLDEVSRSIGRHVASLIPNGATLQTGIGKIPHAVLEALADHRDLGVHTEMLSDSVIDLVEAGVITGREKTLLPGKLVTSFVMGSERLYRWVDDNPAVEMRPSQFTNDPMVVAQNDRMVAINSALAVDLTGQVASDSLAGRFVSGIGGQVDFIRGAARSRGGVPIIALPSTAKGGTISRITPLLDPGHGVVTSRGDVRFVVTEYGVADLWGKSIRQRATALIEIAHPSFRTELLSAAKQRRYVFPDQVAPRAPYPHSEASKTRLHDGSEVTVRPARMSDIEPLQDFFYRLSDESLYSRFMEFKRRHPREEIRELVDLDFEDNMALVATPAGAAQPILAIARYDVEPKNRLADVAFVVADDWQGKGLGTFLMKRLTEIAQSRDIAGFTADVLAGNLDMLDIFHRSGLKVHADRDDSTYHLVMAFPRDEDRQAARPSDAAP
jgi:acyl-CoA hydrolase/GNAT superfamily N-acetyltransferase